MSVLVSEPLLLADPLPVVEPSSALRIVDAATRLHAWSIPIPCCIHGSPLDRHCNGCDDVAGAVPPLERL
jgi:hypothetical protein